MGRLATFTRPELINVVSLARCVRPGHAYAEPDQPGDKPAVNGARKRGRKRPDLALSELERWVERMGRR